MAALDTPVAFLDGATPGEWVAAACARLPELLQDHANCELKAASTALALIYRYPERSSLVQRTSRLAREELRHFEQVRKLMQEMAIPFVRLSASRYASSLMRAVRPAEPGRLLDTLLVGALIEARSCERFGALAPHLPPRVSRFYAGLLESEARHYAHYLEFARTESGVDDPEIERRLAGLKELEGSLIRQPDPQFRFHSGIPSPLQEPPSTRNGAKADR